MTTLHDMKISGEGISHAGLMLLGYQRTKQISRKAKVSWEAGDRAVLDAEIKARGPSVFSGAMEEIFAEYLPLRTFLRTHEITPKHVVDIGCGQALNDAFLSKDFGSSFTLIDIEDTPEKYHLWNASGSGYAALTDARKFLIANGADKNAVKTINPRKAPQLMAGVAGDMVTSLFSCGFHYPIGEYVDLMCNTVAQGGCVVLDLRLRYLGAPDAALQRLLDSGKQHVILEMAKSKRIVFRA
ncbi:MAG: hypothetical protein WCC57_08855 [Paracoccaceae bacterium]